MASKPVSDFAVMDFSSLQRFVDGQVLLVDKPLEWTSFDVVNKLRWALRNALGVKKFKVGHAGTLDPLATGVLVICTGRATKAIEGLQSDAKSYTATIRLGAQTPCLDAELPVEKWVDAGHIDRAAVEAAALQQTGPIAQMPPLYSAKKIKGQKAYAVARKGGDIELKPAHIEITRFAVTSVEPRTVDGRHAVVDVTAEIDCSKGTYIRAIARDLGEALGVGAYLTGLRRTASGVYKIDQCAPLEDLLKQVASIPA
jgi:tRNA pseudouridine55 synthase